MRHKYVTRAFVLSRGTLREAGASVTLLTPDLGLLRARAEGLRKPGAKLAHALQTLCECDATVLRGKDGWRLSGAVLEENWFKRLSPDARLRAGRIAGLTLRLVQGESADPTLFAIWSGFLDVLREADEDAADAAECIAALRMLHALGLDSGPLPEGSDTFAPHALSLSPDERRALITRINRGIQASGL